MEQLQIKNDTLKLQQLLGSKLYSDKYSFIQECLQNSTDAMRKCGKYKECFDVNIDHVDNNYYFSIRDYGCSFDSIEEFKRLIGTLLESSKTQNKDNTENQELGKFGIGSISLAAYNKKWEYVIYKNGKAFNAKLQEIEGKGLFMETSDYYETEEKDGVYIKVKILDKVNIFVTKLLQKAKYFQNIKFNFDSFTLDELKYYNNFLFENYIKINEYFKIFKTDDFQFSTLNEDENIHICLDQYSYDIKWSELGIEPVKLPIALRFNINEFETNPTREVLIIDSNYKQKILDKLEKVTDWFVEKWNQENPIKECINFLDLKNELKKRELKIVNIQNHLFNIEQIHYLFSIKSFNELTFKNININTFYKFEDFIKRTKYDFYKQIATITGYNLRRFDNIDIYNDKCYFIKKSFSKNNRNYFKEHINGKNTILKKNNVRFVFEPLKNDNTEYSYLNYLKFYEKYDEKEIEYIKKEFRDLNVLLQSFEESIPYVEDIIPINYINKQSKKENIKVEKNEDEIILKYPRSPQKYITWNAVWEDKVLKINKLKNLKALHIYGTENNRRKLEKIFTFTNKTNLQSIMVNEKTEKMIKEENPHNFIHIDNLKNKLSNISNYITVLHITTELKDYQYLFNYVDMIEEHISSTIAKDIESIKQLCRDYSISSNNLFEEIYELFKENPTLFNQEYIYLFNKVDKIKENLDFLPIFSDKVTSYYKNHKLYELSLKTMREICRIRKIKMNWNNYNLDKI
jgi:hypothetical protein